MNKHEREFVRMVNGYVGSRLRELRLLRYMTQAQLGQELGITYQQIQKYETGQSAIQAGRLYHIAHVLAVSPMYFYEGLQGRKTVKLPEDRQEWLRLAATLANIHNSEVRQGIKALILAADKVERALHAPKKG